VDIVAYLARLLFRAEKLLSEAEKSGKVDPATGERLPLSPRRLSLALKAIDTMQSVAKTYGVGTGQLKTGGAVVDNRSLTVNVQSSEEWLSLRGRLVSALDDFPEAKAHVLLALAGPVDQPDARRVAIAPWRPERLPEEEALDGDFEVRDV